MFLKGQHFGHLQIKGQCFIYSLKIQPFAQFCKERAILLVTGKIIKFLYQPSHSCQLDFISKNKGYYLLLHTWNYLL